VESGCVSWDNIPSAQQVRRSHRQRSAHHPSPTRHRGTNPWTPIYLQLLAELKATLEAAGHRYDRLADARLIDHAERFNWRCYLTRPD
jgi:hypothetical protein